MKKKDGRELQFGELSDEFVILLILDHFLGLQGGHLTRILECWKNLRVRLHQQGWNLHMCNVPEIMLQIPPVQEV